MFDKKEKKDKYTVRSIALKQGMNGWVIEIDCEEVIRDQIYVFARWEQVIEFLADLGKTNHSIKHAKNNTTSE